MEGVGPTVRRCTTTTLAVAMEKHADLLAATKQQEDEQPEIVEAEIEQSIRQLPSMNGAGEPCMLAWCKVAICLCNKWHEELCIMFWVH